MCSKAFPQLFNPVYDEVFEKKIAFFRFFYPLNKICLYLRLHREWFRGFMDK
jgi:hypothetical protein